MELIKLKNNLFLKDIDWDNIKNVKAPFIPFIENDWDNKYFDKFSEEETFYPLDDKKEKKRC